PSVTSSGGIDAGGQTISNVADGVASDDAATVGQITDLATTPLTFAGDSGTNVERQLGETLNVTGGASGALTSGNIGVVGDGTDTLAIQLAENVDLGTDGSVTTGNSTLDDSGLAVDDGSGNVTTVTDDGLTVAGGPSVTSSGGIDAGGQTISNVADGVASDDAATVGQITDLATTPLTFAGDSGTNVERQLGETLNVTGGASGVLTSGNIGVVGDGTDTLTIQLAENVDLGTDGSVTTGNSTLDDGGLAVDDGSGNVTTVTDDGLIVAGGPSVTSSGGIDAGGQTISNVAAPVNGGDAINLGYFDENRAHYYSVNDDGVIGGNYNNDGATGINAIATGVDAEASIDGSVALGSGSIANRNLAPSSGAIPAGSATVTYNTTDKELLGAISVGDSDSYRQITNVADGILAQDAVTVRQLQGAIGSVTVTGTQYFHANSVQPDSAAVGQDSIAVGPTTVVDGDNGIGMGNGAIVDQIAPGGTAIGDGAHVMLADGMALGTSALSEAEQGIALGAGATVSHDQSVALGSNSATAEPVATSGTTIAGIDYGFAGIAPQSTVSIGDVGNERTLTNVAAGRLSETSTDAVNGSQLYATNQAVESASQGWDLSAQGADTTNVAPGDSVDLSNTDGNLVIAKNATDGAQETVTFDLADDLDVTSVSTGNSTLSNSGLVVDDGGGNVTSTTATGTTVTDGTNTTSLTAIGVSSGNISVDGTTDTITGLSNTDLSDPSFATEGRAATEEQLQVVSDVASAGWDLSAQGADTTNVAPGDALDLSNADGNLVISKNATDGPQETVSFDLAEDVTIGSSLTVTDGPTIDGDGIDMGGDSITNVGAPTSGGDAVNLDYFNQNRAHYYSVNDGGTQGGNYDNDGATGVNAIAAGVDASASADGAMALGAGATAGDADSVALGANSATAPVEGTTEVVINGETYLVAGTDPEGTVSLGDVDAERTATNVAAGRVSETSTDAINGSQLYATNSAIDALGQEVEAGQVHYYSVNDAGTEGGNHDNDGATGVNAIAAGVDASATAEGSIAMGAGAMASEADSVAMGSGATTEAAVGTADITIGGQTYAFAGVSPIGTFSVGSAGAERTITHVAAGRVTADSTDAINGSQLYATNQAVGDVNQAVGDVEDRVTNVEGDIDNLDGRVTNVEGDVTQLGDRVSNVEGDVSSIGNDLAELDDRAVKYDTEDGNVNYDSITLAGEGGTTISNVADGDVSEDSSDAVNGSQLWEMQEQLTTINEGGSKYFRANSEAAAARAEGAESVAMGPNSVAQGDHSVAAGDGAVAESDGGVALGAGSQATREGMNGAEEAFSGESVASTQGAVSVGSEGGERQITNVAGGTEATDAVNVRQLEAVQAGSVGYDRNDDGSVNYGSVTLGQEGTPTQIHNVAAGELPTDAANVGQLQELNRQFNQQIGSLSHRIEDVEDQANAGTASAIAAASVPQAYLPGKSMVAVGAGTYSGESAVSVGVSRLSDNGRWAVKLNATGDSQSNFGAGVGVGFHW
ncbi:YadA-like family protein, partial [Halomonas organivorans]